MKLTNTEISCHQMILSVLGLGYIYLSGWSKDSHGNPQRTQAVVLILNPEAISEGV